MGNAQASHKQRLQPDSLPDEMLHMGGNSFFPITAQEQITTAIDIDLLREGRRSNAHLVAHTAY
jgi:hypothetical protein